VLEEAFKAGGLAGEPNRITSVSSWPVKVLCGIQDIEKLKKEVARLLGVIQQEPSPVKRADALNLLLGALVNGPQSIFWQVYEAFFQASTSGLRSGKRNSKGESLLARWAAVISEFDSKRGKELIEDIQGRTIRSRAMRAIEKSPCNAMAMISWPNMG
jgi:hypothetical protein